MWTLFRSGRVSSEIAPNIPYLDQLRRVFQRPLNAADIANQYDGVLLNNECLEEAPG